MADDTNDPEAHSHESLSTALGALGPGGMAALRFEDYTRLFGHEPTEDEIEGERAHRFARDNRCSQAVDHERREVIFRRDV